MNEIAALDHVDIATTVFVLSTRNVTDPATESKCTPRKCHTPSLTIVGPVIVRDTDGFSTRKRTTPAVVTSTHASHTFPLLSGKSTLSELVEVLRRTQHCT